MALHAHEHVGEVRQRVDAAPLGAPDERQERAQVLARVLAAYEEVDLGATGPRFATGR